MKVYPSSNNQVSFYSSYRFLLGVIGFFGYCFQYMQKIDMGIGIVCMVNHTALLESHILNNKSDTSDNFTHQTNTSLNSCLARESSKSHSSSRGTFVWQKNIQGFILSAYFYGYISFQIIAGILASKFGSKIMIFIGMFFGSLTTLLVPLTANWSYIALIICRLLNGMSNAFFMPGMSSFWVYWAPPNERSRLIGMSHAGGMIGNIFALLIGGYLCSTKIGWPLIFYIFGGFGMAWTLLMLVLYSNSPKEHRFISEKEKSYILEETKISSKPNNLKIPWKGIFTSKACYSIFISHLCNNWGIYLFMTQIPSYMKEVLNFDIKSNGLMTSIPFLACWIFINISSLIGDKLLQTGKMSRKNVRKIFNGIGLSVPVLALFCLSFVTCSNPYIGVFLLTIGFAFMGFSLGAGYYVNINDVSGPFSSIVFGISNTFGSIPGLICPYLTAVITKHQTQAEWRIVFIIAACVYLFGFVFYTIFGNADLESWAILEKEKLKESKTETEFLEIN